MIEAMERIDVILGLTVLNTVLMLYANEQMKETFFSTVELEKHSETKITIP